MNQGYITSRDAFICLKAAPQALLKVTLKKIPTLELVLDLWWAHQDLYLGPKDCRI